MNTLPKISVITISYNSKDTIEKTIQSVVSQDYANKEYIVIDGGSTDGTTDIIRQYSSDISYFVSEPDNGISDAFNKGIRHATGDLIVLINSDDYLLPEALQNVAQHYDTATDIFCCNLILWNDRSDEKRIIKPSTDFPTMPFFRRPAHQGAFITKALYERIGLYDTEIRYAMDLDFLMRATRQQATFRHLDINVAVFRLGGATNESIFKKRKEYLTIVRKNGGSWLQAQLFYAFLVITQTTKKALRLTGIDWVRKIRYRSASHLAQ